MVCRSFGPIWTFKMCKIELVSDTYLFQNGYEIAIDNQKEEIPIVISDITMNRIVSSKGIRKSELDEVAKLGNFTIHKNVIKYEKHNFLFRKHARCKIIKL